MQHNNQNNYDDNVVRFKKPESPKRVAPPPMINLPFATKTLIFIMFVLHLIVWYAPSMLAVLPDNIWWLYNFGFVPLKMSDTSLFNPLVTLTPITYAFLHAGWLHILSNILMLAAFGAGLEKNYSARLMLFIFFGSSVFAALLHFIFDMNGTNPVIGASGGISGLFGAVLLMLKAQGGLNRTNSLMPIIAVWLGVTILFGFMGAPDGSMVAWIAHIGGFLGGLGLMALVIKMKWAR